MSGPELSAEEGCGTHLSACAAREGKEARVACWADRAGGLGKELG